MADFNQAKVTRQAKRVAKAIRQHEAAGRRVAVELAAWCAIQDQASYDEGLPLRHVETADALMGRQDRLNDEIERLVKGE